MDQKQSSFFWSRAKEEATAVTLSSALCVLPWRRAASLLADGGSVAKDLAGDGFVRVAAMGGPWVQGAGAGEEGGEEELASWRRHVFSLQGCGVFAASAERLSKLCRPELTFWYSHFGPYSVMAPG